MSSLGFCVVFPTRYATVSWRGPLCDKGALGMLIWFIQMYLSAKSLNLSASASLCPSRSPLPKARSSVRDAQVQLFPPVSRKQAVCAKCEELHILSLAPPRPRNGPTCWDFGRFPVIVRVRAANGVVIFCRGASLALLKGRGLGDEWVSALFEDLAAWGNQTTRPFRDAIIVPDDDDSLRNNNHVDSVGTVRALWSGYRLRNNVHRSVGLGLMSQLCQKPLNFLLSWGEWMRPLGTMWLPSHLPVSLINSPAVDMNFVIWQISSGKHNKI